MALFRSLHQISRFFFPAQSIIHPRFHSTQVSLQNIDTTTKTEKHEEVSSDVISTCNNLAQENNSRCFAIVHLLGKQWRVTDGDLIVVEGFWPPSIGDKIKLDKILLAGTKDFSLIGRPLVQRGLVDITATVISKGLSHTKTHFKKKPKKQYMRINFHRCEQTILRINSVRIGSSINSLENVF